MQGRTTVQLPPVFGCHSPIGVQRVPERLREGGEKKAHTSPVKRNPASFLSHAFPNRYWLKHLLRENDVIIDLSTLCDDYYRIVSSFLGKMGITLTPAKGKDPIENLSDMYEETERLLEPFNTSIQFYVVDKKIQFRVFKDIGIFSQTFLYVPLSKVEGIKGKERQWLLDFLGIVKETQYIFDDADNGTLEFWLSDDDMTDNAEYMAKTDFTENYGERIKMMKIYNNGPYRRLMKRIKHPKRNIDQLVKAYKRMTISDENKEMFEVLVKGIRYLEKYSLIDFVADLHSSSMNCFSDDESASDNIMMNIFVWNLNTDVICEGCYDMMNDEYQNMEGSPYVQWKLLTDEDNDPLPELPDIKEYEEYMYEVIRQLDE